MTEPRREFDEYVGGEVPITQPPEPNQMPPKTGVLKSIYEKGKQTLKRVFQKKPEMSVEEMKQKTEELKAKAEMVGAQAELEKSHQDLDEQKARGPKTKMKKWLARIGLAGLVTAGVIGGNSVRKIGGPERIQNASDKAMEGVVSTVEAAGDTAKAAGDVLEEGSKGVSGLSGWIDSRGGEDILKFMKNAQRYPKVLWGRAVRTWNETYPERPMTKEQLGQMISKMEKMNKEGLTLDKEVAEELGKEICGWKDTRKATSDNARQAARNYQIVRPPKRDGR